MEEAAKIKAEIDAAPLLFDDLRGKVDVKWYGHAGFKVHFKDAEDVQRNIYIDVWADNKDCSEADKKRCPNDADLMLVSCGQLDHSFHAPFMMLRGKREGRQIVCTSEVGLYIEGLRGIPAPAYAKMQPGGTKDFGYAKITMTSAEFSSTCQGPEGIPIAGGIGVGFVITIPHHNFSVYYAGPTNIFSDMKLIDGLYKPNVAILPLGGDIKGMQPREAAYAVKNFLPTPKTIIPIEFTSIEDCSNGTFANFKKECEAIGVEGKELINPRDFLASKAVLE